MRKPLIANRTSVRATRFHCERLEERDVPAIYGVSFTGPTDDSGATISGTILLQGGAQTPAGVVALAGEVFVDATDAEAALFAAVQVTATASWQGKSDTYTFGQTTVTRNPSSHPNREAFALTQPDAAQQPHAWRIGLEDLSGPNMRVLGPNGDADWDYNDRTWTINVRAPQAPQLGTGTGLRADYYNTQDFNELGLIRVDPQVNNHWDGQPDPKIHDDHFSVKWTGKVQPEYSGKVTFTTVSDDGVRLWVNGQQLVNNWTDHSPTRDSGTIELVAGTKYDIRMEYYDNTKGADAKLLWSGADLAEEAVPQSQLYPEPIPQATIGDGTGLLARYYNSQNFSELGLIRVDPQVNNHWAGQPDPTIHADHFSVRWLGQIQPKFGGEVTFTTVSDDGVRLSVNGQLLIDNWTDHSPTRDSKTISLVAGMKYDIRMDYYENKAGADAKLLWSGKDLPEEVIPQSQLYPQADEIPFADGQGTGLSGQYFGKRDLTDPKAKRTDGQVNFDWGTGAPITGVGVDNFSVRWLGTVTPRYDGAYTFYTLSDDGVRLTVNGQRIIDQWNNHGPRQDSGQVTLTGGQKYDIKMEYYENVGGAVAKLSWSSDNQVKEIIPQSQLNPLPQPQFVVREVTFDSSASRAIWSDDGNTKYNSQQWLDANANGQIDAATDHQDPVLFVRNQGVKVEKLVLTAPNDFGLDSTKYQAHGFVTLNGVATGITLTSGPGSKVGSDWVFTNLTTTQQFDKVSYDPAMSIRWTVERIADTDVQIWDGSTTNPAYVSYAAVDASAPAGFKMLRSLLHWGSANAAGAANTKDGITLAAWKAFEGNELTTWDGKKIVYYKNWDDPSHAANPVAVGSIGESCNCINFATLLISALRAQGIENADDYYDIRPKQVAAANYAIAGPYYGKPLDGPYAHEVLLVKDWAPKANGAATETVVGYKWTNGSVAGQFFAKTAATGQWNYTFSPEEIAKTTGMLAGQNNADPLAIFVNHVVVQLTVGGVTQLYDTSYGVVYANQADFESKAIAYFGLGFYDPAGNRSLKLAIRDNLPGQETTRGQIVKDF